MVSVPLPLWACDLVFKTLGVCVCVCVSVIEHLFCFAALSGLLVCQYQYSIHSNIKMSQYLVAYDFQSSPYHVILSLHVYHGFSLSFALSYVSKNELIMFYQRRKGKGKERKKGRKEGEKDGKKEEKHKKPCLDVLLEFSS